MYYGPLVAETQGGDLLLSVGPRKTPVRLKHWAGDTFAISLPGYGAPTYTDGFVTFVFGEAAQALELRFIRGFDDADDGRFTRAADQVAISAMLGPIRRCSTP